MNQGRFQRSSIRGGFSSRLSVVLCLSAELYLPASPGQAATGAAPILPPPATRSVDFLKDIQPLLSSRCYSCHGPDKQKSDLRWDLKSSVFKSGDHGPILTPGKRADSRVIKLV